MREYYFVDEFGVQILIPSLFVIYGAKVYQYHILNKEKLSGIWHRLVLNSVKTMLIFYGVLIFYFMGMAYFEETETWLTRFLLSDNLLVIFTRIVVFLVPLF